MCEGWKIIKRDWGNSGNLVVEGLMKGDNFYKAS